MGALALFAKVKAGQALLGMARKFMAKGGAAEAVEKAAKPANKSVQALEQAAAQKKNVVQQVKAAAKDAPLKITAPSEGAAVQAVEAAGKGAARGGFMGTMRNLAQWTRGAFNARRLTSKSAKPAGNGGRILSRITI